MRQLLNGTFSWTGPGGSVMACAALALVCMLAVWGCSANDPFDPDTLANNPPVVRLYVAPVDSGGSLSPTSYFDRTFYWSGTDRDGWVREFYVSIRTDSDVPAPWDTTTRTDTTMTFTTDTTGLAEATFLLACRDDRGALSDTLIQFIPLRNFPPVINFQSDFEVLQNMQREFVPNGAGQDTVYWNWGPMSLRLFALDLDGAATMDSYYRYTLFDIDPDLGLEPTETYDEGDPLGDPEIHWIRAPFSGSGEVRNFEIILDGADPGAPRTITVSVKDEAQADARFQYSWEVRAPLGPVLYIPDNSSLNTKAFQTGVLDAHLGAGNWNTYDFWFGFPDSPTILLQSFRLFDVIVWTDGGSTSNNLVAASARGGVLEQYLVPVQGQDPGRLLLASKGIAGQNTRVNPYFSQTLLGISPTGDPQPALVISSARTALGQQAYLPDLVTPANTSGGIGLKLLSGTEALYQMELCPGCYSARPSYEPVIGARKPARTTQPLASVVSFGVNIGEFDSGQAVAAYRAILEQDLGVAPQ